MELLPGLVWDGAVLLTADVQAGTRAIAEGARIPGQTIDAEALEDGPIALLITATEPEEIDVGRVRHALQKGLRSVGGVVLERLTDAGILVGFDVHHAFRLNHRVAVGHAFLERRRASDQFEHRPRWVLARERARKHRRLFLVVEQLLKLVVARAIADDVGVEAGGADHRQDLAVARVHHDGRATGGVAQAFLQDAGDVALQVEVE